MDIRALLKQGSSLEELEQSLLDLDSEFDFKCRHCGKCCKNQDTVCLLPEISTISQRNLVRPQSMSSRSAERYRLDIRPGFRWSIWCQLARNVVVHCYGMMDAAVSMTASLQPAHCFL